MSRPTTSPGRTANALHAEFLSLLPRVELHGRVYFRHLRSPQAREEAVAEAVALAWRWFLLLTRRGKDPGQFPSALAAFAARAVRAGRRLCGIDPAGDVLSPRAQRAKGFAVVRLPDVPSTAGNAFDEALVDNTQTPVPDQAAFRQDFPAWLRTRTARDRELVRQLMRGERTRDVAPRFGLSQARVSQLRREFRDDWSRFCADPADGRCGHVSRPREQACPN
jgi:hypothetical protein